MRHDASNIDWWVGCTCDIKTNFVVQSFWLAMPLELTSACGFDCEHNGLARKNATKN